MLDFAVFPHLSRHPIAAAAGIVGKRRTWAWIQEHVRGGVRNPEWRQEDPVDRIGIVFAQFFHRIGDCRLPLYFDPKMATGLHAMWCIISGRRTRVNNWKMGSLHRGRRAYREVASRNSGRPRGRLLWELAKVVDGGTESYRKWGDYE